MKRLLYIDESVLEASLEDVRSLRDKCAGANKSALIIVELLCVQDVG